MKLKRILNSAGQCTHVEVGHTGFDARQNFSRRLVEAALTEGWATLSNQHLVIKAMPESLIYRVLRKPGYYSEATGERVPISEVAWSAFLSTGTGKLSRQEAMAWLVRHGEPAEGYVITMAYECELDTEQHDRFTAVRNVAGNLVAAHTLIGG